MSQPISAVVSVSSFLSKKKDEQLKKKPIVSIEHVTYDDDLEEKSEVVRGLKSRHIQLIALGGAIGTGLFIGSGSALSVCGPAPLLTSYMITAFCVWLVMNQLGEMVIFLPISGNASVYALTKKYLNSPLSFTAGWNLFYAQAMVPPSEVTACALIIEYWTDANSAIFISIFGIATIGMNFRPVKYYGESEFCVAIIKILCITGLIILGVVIFFGGGPNQDGVLGFHYWKHPGAFVDYLVPGNTGRFLATWTAIVKSGFAFVLTPEILASCAAEAENPRRSMPKAFRRVIYRLIFFYVGGVLVIGVIVASNNSRLMSAIAAGKSNAAASPFVIGISEVGIKVLPHIVNACFLTSAYSAGTSQLYAASRSLHSMAINGDAPRIFGKLNRWGVPYYSVGLGSLFIFLSYLNCSNTSSTVFAWLSNIVSISGFLSWMFVGICYLRFRNIIDYLDLNDRIPYRVPLMRYGAYFTTGFFAILSLTNEVLRLFPTKLVYK
ncbi:hypothetical protein PGUG_04500 [Meyerozyma guilliermondii ATCC 6260]|uniref:Amino acid permease/ SLC12A domain-containing protein n=1 Tax=Meyerozyma guilliermondii (strain ATCC 6260 / CBS 566 / DSM 6381 / JCM 1539 / NBRC 10279 / NRRL Y-324) TaxID=294746 RepID=A5DMJ9_PICGU|nr:uncharacterized protein PGUG_04500 [Meyerozyma guilliermondii ATCC 6260]EDK40402.1 hypothetical protein PGUG_04500 [Meyerozyma guilliermondii ATCC 6260]